jgi:hypothetical protein
MPTPHVRRPISSRHAFALAFDLAFRRDLLHSVVVPVALQAPWILAFALTQPESADDAPVSLPIAAASALGGWLVSIVIGAMQRFRAQSVFNTPLDVKPAPVSLCYARGMRRVPWLYVTEAVRNLVLGSAFAFFFLPGVLFSYKLAIATESVVLHEPNLVRAFQRSLHVMQGRFERWLEMFVLSILLALGGMILAVPLWIASGLSTAGAYAIGLLIIVALMPVIQYAWTFFYLRLVEVEEPGAEAPPAWARSLGVSVPGEPPDPPARGA